MIKRQAQELSSEILNEDHVEMLYEFNEILESLNFSLKNKTPLCFFLLDDDDVAICISPVKKIIESTSTDKREAEVILDQDNMVIRLHNILAVGQYEQDRD